jgi:hypothetical protein
MGRFMNYRDAVEAGYDGPSPFDAKRLAKRIERNNRLDCRDPDHDSRLCPRCGEEWLDEDGTFTQEALDKLEEMKNDK